MIKHNTLYEVLLAMYALFTFCTAAWVLLLVQGPSYEKTIALAYCLFLCVMTVVVLVLRRRKHRFARIATRVASIIYLPFPPFGTALGIYGLLVVDRRRKNKVGKETDRSY